MPDPTDPTADPAAAPPPPAGTPGGPPPGLFRRLVELAHELAATPEGRKVLADLTAALAGALAHDRAAGPAPPAG